MAVVVLAAVGCASLGDEQPRDDPNYDMAPFARLMGETRQDEEADEAEPQTWPNVQDPGPDLANFPNSVYTVPRNAFHVEWSPVTLNGPSDDSGPSYSTQYLVRFGLTDRLELRTFGLGYTAVFDGPQRTTGFAPIAFDLKMNLWEESSNHLIPAAGLEVYLQTEFGSPAFRGGTQPGIILLFDHTLPGEINFEWNVGLNGAEAQLLEGGDLNGPINTVQGPEANEYEWSLQWALQRRFFDKLDVFAQGYLNSSAIPSLGDGVMVGAGGIYTLSKRTALFGSYNAGLTRDSPTTFFQLGLATAF